MLVQNTHISQSNTVAHLRCGMIFNESFIAKCKLSIRAKNWKSINI